MLPITEQENPKTTKIDSLSTADALRLINEEDASIATAVRKELPRIAEAVDRIVPRLENGGRLFYVGTGTSGRLGVLDASEIPPTYGVSNELVQGIIAGGYGALYKASEASEDNKAQGAEDLKARGVNEKDAVVGIAASGRTPYTIGAVEYARSIGCLTACIVCNPDSGIMKAVDIAIAPVVGPEVIAGSTRMKAGTAQKMVLNMISTMVMVRLGYVSGNWMVSMKPSNEKLRVRGIRMLAAESGLSFEEARRLLAEAGGDLRVATLMLRGGLSAAAALTALEKNAFSVERAAADSLTNKK